MNQSIGHSMIFGTRNDEPSVEGALDKDFSIGSDGLTTSSLNGVKSSTGPAMGSTSSVGTAERVSIYFRMSSSCPMYFSFSSLDKANLPSIAT